MATFTIDSENNIAAHAEVPASSENMQSFASEKELAKLASEGPGIRLVEVWNSFAGVAPISELKPVKKFTDRKSAVARIWAAIQRLSPDGGQPPADVAPAKEPEEVPDEARQTRPRPKGRQGRGGTHE